MLHLYYYEHQCEKYAKFFAEKHCHPFMLIVLAELKVSVSNCEKMSYKIASRLRFSRADRTYKDVRTLVITIFL